MLLRVEDIHMMTIPPMDKTAISVVSMDEQRDEVLYRQTRSYEERLAALELLREIFYGRERVRGRMERILTVHQFGDNDD
jgi:hypothetical protein